MSSMSGRLAPRGVRNPPEPLLSVGEDRRRDDPRRSDATAEARTGMSDRQPSGPSPGCGTLWSLYMDMPRFCPSVTRKKTKKETPVQVSDPRLWLPVVSGPPIKRPPRPLQDRWTGRLPPLGLRIIWS